MSQNNAQLQRKYNGQTVN